MTAGAGAAGAGMIATAATGDVFKGIAEPGWEVAPRPFRVRNIGEDIWLQAACILASAFRCPEILLLVFPTPFVCSSFMAVYGVSCSLLSCAFPHSWPL